MTIHTGMHRIELNPDKKIFLKKGESKKRETLLAGCSRKPATWPHARKSDTAHHSPITNQSSTATTMTKVFVHRTETARRRRRRRQLVAVAVELSLSSLLWFFLVLSSSSSTSSYFYLLLPIAPAMSFSISNRQSGRRVPARRLVTREFVPATPKKPLLSPLSPPPPAAAVAVKPGITYRLFMSSFDDDKDVGSSDDGDEKFGFFQRIESVKSLAIGAVAGSVAVVPFAAVQDLLLLSTAAPAVQTGGVAQWEWDCDTAALESGLFAIVYRYCVRQDAEANPQLKDGVVAAFAVTRTLSKIVVSPYCIPIPLNCTFS